MYRSLLTAASALFALSVGSTASVHAQDAAAPAAESAAAPSQAAAPAPSAAPAAPTQTDTPVSQDVAALSPNLGASPAPAAYLAGPSRVSEADMAAWLANPAAILATYPQGGAGLANQARLLAASSNRAVPALLALASQATTTPVQRAAIGAGLARAAQAGQVTAPAYAAFIQEAVAASGNPSLIAAYTTALAQPATAALGAAGGGGGAAGGGAGAGAGSLSGGGAAGSSAGTAAGSNSSVANTDGAAAAITRSSSSFTATDGTGASTTNIFVTGGTTNNTTNITNNTVTTTPSTLPAVTENGDASPAS